MPKSQRKKERVKPDFKVDYIPKSAEYNPIMDKNLQYYFASKQNKNILRKNGIINRRNQIVDRDIIKLSQKGYSLCSNFKIKNKGISFKNINKNIGERQVDQWGFLEGNMEKNKKTFYLKERKLNKTQELSRNERRKRVLHQTLDMPRRPHELILSQKSENQRTEPKMLDRDDFQNYLQQQKQKIQKLLNESKNAM